jgi:hypothetical protein
MPRQTESKVESNFSIATRLNWRMLNLISAGLLRAIEHVVCVLEQLPR